MHRGEILRDCVTDWGNRTQIRKDRFEIVVGQLPIPLPGHQGAQRLAITPYPRAQHFDEIRLRPCTNPCRIVGGEISGKRGSSGASKTGRGRARRNSPRYRGGRGRHHMWPAIHRSPGYPSSSVKTCSCCTTSAAVTASPIHVGCHGGEIEWPGSLNFGRGTTLPKLSA
jgi:hypothetical protein